MAEGLADLALYVAIGPKWGGWASEIYADLGLRFDGERAQAVSEATAALADVRQDAALMLHDEHRDVDDVVAFLRRWLLVNDERARQIAAVSVVAAVAGLHQHVRRGIPAAPGMAGRASGRGQSHRAVRQAARRAADPVGPASRLARACGFVRDPPGPDETAQSVKNPGT